MKDTHENTPARAVRFVGITADARALGVHRVTLYKMLTGKPGFAELKSLRRRYEALQSRKARK